MLLFSGAFSAEIFIPEVEDTNEKIVNMKIKTAVVPGRITIGLFIAAIIIALAILAASAWY
jgi:hypothetical protein